jgi:RES domain
VTDGRVLRALGLTESDTKGEYSESQAISAAIHGAGWNVHGICYASRLEPKLKCVALFDFPSAEIFALDLGALSSDANRNLASSMLEEYSIRLIQT